METETNKSTQLVSLNDGKPQKDNNNLARRGAGGVGAGQDRPTMFKERCSSTLEDGIMYILSIPSIASQKN